MNKRQKLGQHFLKSQSIASKIIQAANISKSDIVLEIGTGPGILTPNLCKYAQKVISIEADKSLFDAAISKFSLENLEMIHGNGFKSNKKFSIFVSNLPYSKSKTATEWLCQKKFSHGVIMVQKEFADKLLEQNLAVSVIANHCFEIKKIIKVGKNNFSPPPKVDSVVLELQQKNTLSYDVIKTINLIFSYRRKTISNIMKKFGKSSDSKERLDDLSGDEIIKIAKQINRR